MRINKKIVNAACLLLLLLAMPVLADQLTSQDLTNAALSANAPELSATAFSEKLFGDIALNPLQLIGAPNTILSQVLILVNLALMAMAGAWVSWSVTKGAFATAHEGKFIGQSMHSAWVPFRLTFGVASLIPFFKGLCLSQIVMLGAIQLSIGAGNLAWQRAVTYVYSGNMVVNPTRATSNNDLTQDLFNSALCVHSLNYGLAMLDFQPTYQNSLSGNQWRFGSGKNGTECGVFELPNAGSTPLSQQNAARRIASFKNLLNSLDQEALRIARTTTESILDPTANINVQIDKTYLPRASAAEYAELSMITEDLSRAANDGTRKGELLQGAEAAAQTQGFATAGAWFFGLASKNKITTDAISQSVKLGKPALQANDPAFLGANDIYLKTSTLTQGETIIKGEKYDYSNENFALKSIKTAICGDKTVSGVTLSLGQCVVTKTISLGNTDQTALIRIAELGNGITALGATALTAFGAAQGAIEGADKSVVAKAADLVGGGIAIGAVKGSIMIWLETLKEATKVLLFFGLVASTYIPLIPAIVWIMRMLTIASKWVEAVVSASVWAFSHLDTEGEGMGSRSGHGYTFLFNVLLNPMLSVIGLVLGTVLLDIMTSFVLHLYPDMIANASGDSWTGLLSIMAYLVIFVIINLSLVNLCMQLINTVPDNIIDWIGGRAGAALGKGAEDVVGGGVKNAMNGNGWVPRSSGARNGDSMKKDKKVSVD